MAKVRAGKGFGEDLADGNGRMRGTGAPAVDRGDGEGVVHKGYSLLGLRVGQEVKDWRCFIAPTSPKFNPGDNKAASQEEFGVWTGMKSSQVKSSQPQRPQASPM